MASNDSLIGRVLAGRYRLQQRRGAGGHGIVVDAIDDQLQRAVAVKIMLPQFVATQAVEARFRLEAQVAASMTHPNLNAVYDWGVEEVEGARVPYLVLERLTGGSLRDMLDRGRLLSPSQALMMGLDACRGLDYMHRRGVIHRDLTPANLAFGDDRHLRLLDVGISRMVAEQTWKDAAASGLDAARYASPEQAKGGTPQDGTLDAATDVYSLCLLMIESVTGQVPFAMDSTVATLNARIDKLMPVSADFGPLASVLSRAGSADASQRYSAAAFGRALVQAAEKLPRPAPLPIVGASGQLGDSTGGIRRPSDPTGPLQRISLADGSDTSGPIARPDTPDVPPTVTQPLVPPAPPLSVDATVPADVALTPLPIIPPHPPGVPLDEPAPLPPLPAAVTPPPVLKLVLADQTAPTPAVTPSIAQPPGPPPMPFEVARPAEAVRPAVAEPEPTTQMPPIGQVVLTSGAAPDPGAAEQDPRLYDQEFDEPGRHRAGWIIGVLVIVLALAAGGFVAYRVLGDKQHTVPALTGVAEAVARNQIAEDGWTIVVRTERSDTQPQGTIISTDPAAGSTLKEGRTITFVVSAGATLSVLPEVTGMTVDEATALLNTAKLDITVADQVFDEVVPSGTVISWTVPVQSGLTAGMEVTQRTVVAVVVSKGPEPRTVPNLVGLDPSAATQTLNDLGLLSRRDPDVFSPDIPVGMIAAQSVAAGGSLPRGETVAFTVSKGPDLVGVPSLADQTLDQIRATLAAAGLSVGTVTGPSDTGLLGRVSVNGVDVHLGDVFPRGTVLDLEYV